MLMIILRLMFFALLALVAIAIIKRIFLRNNGGVPLWRSFRNPSQLMSGLMLLRMIFPVLLRLLRFLRGPF